VFSKPQHGNVLKWLLVFILVVIMGLMAFSYLIYARLSADLPDVKTLHNFNYEVPLSIYSKDGLLIDQFGGNKRIPVKIEDVPDQLIHAFLAAEDDNFFEHPGVDYKGLLRAGFQLAMTGKKRQGGSTITMQVTRNVLLTSEKTFSRKLKEIILALKIEREYSKKKILELYLNQIYMGNSAYGVVAAAQTYYGKTLAELTLPEQAMIAGLPKAPSAYNPIKDLNRAIERRNYVLQRMLELNFISKSDFESAQQTPSTAKLQYHTSQFSAPYIAEMVRQYIYDKYGEKAYTLGLKVYTTIDSNLQKTAEQAVHHALHVYDERHGFRILPKPSDDLVDQSTKKDPIIGDTLLAEVISTKGNTIKVKLYNQKELDIPWHKVKWGGSKLKNYIKQGAEIRVRQQKNKDWTITQIPSVEGAFVSLDPKDGAILSLIGGFEFNQNKFNRATQSKRQPGSGFKPIIYTAALEQGYTAASMVNDAPIVIFDPGLGRYWKPENSTKKFYGPTSVRKGLTYSRNMVSIQLLKDIGVSKGVEMGLRFGFTKEQLPAGLSLALGSGYATPLQMARMFAVFANGGFLVDPYFIDKIEDNDGNIIYQATPKIACSTCNNNKPENPAPRIISPGINFIMNSMLRDVVRLGTATGAKTLGRSDVAGKTGTTNDERDAWFNGFTPTHVASAWVGHDNFKPLGRHESGGIAALPMWTEYMKTALKNTPVAKFVPPNDVTRKSMGGIVEYIQKGVKLRKQVPIITAAKKPKTSNASKTDSAKNAPKEKPVEALF
jgi:penicillin-binding protein 1A